MTDTSEIMITMHATTQELRKPRQAYPDPERRALIEQMVEQRIRTGSTWEQVAKANDVGLRTVERWRKSDEWRQIEARWRRILREETRTRIAEVTPQAVDVLIELMRDPEIPPFTRMQSAKTLLEFGGIGDEIEEITVEQNDDFIDFLKKAKQSRSVVSRVLDIEPLPSGLLPPQLQGGAADLPDTTPIESRCLAPARSTPQP